MILNNNDEEMLLSIRLSSYKGTYLPFLLWMSPLGVLEPGIKIINPLENNPATGKVLAKRHLGSYLGLTIRSLSTKTHTAVCSLFSLTGLNLTSAHLLKYCFTAHTLYDTVFQ